MERVGSARRRDELDVAMIGLIRERQVACERGRRFDMGRHGAGPRTHRPGGGVGDTGRRVVSADTMKLLRPGTGRVERMAGAFLERPIIDHL